MESNSTKFLHFCGLQRNAKESNHQSQLSQVQEPKTQTSIWTARQHFLLKNNGNRKNVAKSSDLIINIQMVQKSMYTCSQSMHTQTRGSEIMGRTNAGSWWPMVAEFTTPGDPRNLRRGLRPSSLWPPTTLSLPGHHAPGAREYGPANHLRNEASSGVQQWVFNKNLEKKHLKNPGLQDLHKCKSWNSHQEMS